MFCSLWSRFLFVIELTRKVTAKSYLCLFTCASTWAVHLEIAYSLDTASFLNAFARMVARRGKPEVMISYNGMNFMSAERQLRDLVSTLDQTQIKEQVALAWISAVSSSCEVSEERRLKALGDNAVPWRHESNVVIYEISHTTFSAKTSLDKTVKFWWTSIISASLTTVCKKLCIGPLIKLSFYFQYARLAH